jgi:hypothetical protein
MEKEARGRTVPHAQGCGGSGGMSLANPPVAGPAPSYGSTSVKKRTRRTKADVERTKRAILDVVSAEPPMSVWQVFYQLVHRGVVDKTERDYEKIVMWTMKGLRLDGTLPWEWVTDGSRRRQVTRTCDSVDEALRDCSENYRRSALREADDYVEIWCEKDALSAVLWQVTSTYDVPLMVSRGMSSLTFLHGTAEKIIAAADQGMTSYIYQLGDWDPTGVMIPKQIERRLNEMCKQLGCEPPIVVERVALTEEQIAEYNLPTRPTKREGNMHAKNFEGESVELDALPPRVLRDMVRSAIERHVTPEALEALRATEESEREVIKKLITRKAEPWEAAYGDWHGFSVNENSGAEPGGMWDAHK